MAKDYQKYSFFGKSIFVDNSFKIHLDLEYQTLMVVESNYTDFNAVLIYHKEDDSIQLLPRWQTTFVFKGDALYIHREG